MIYKDNNVYYLKSGNGYEVAEISIKYNRTKKKNVLVINGTGEYTSNLEDPKKYTFKELEKELIESGN